jgi:uncharacterized membrane protein
MSKLIAVAFDTPHKAEEVRLDMVKLENDDLVDLEEAVVMVLDRKGKVRFHHSQHMTFPAALSGGFLGTLVGLMIVNPVIALVGGVTGTAVGAAAGALKEVGIEESFMKELSTHLKPGSSALFVVVRKGDPRSIIEELKKYHGEILQTSLSHQNEETLKKALEKI